MFTIKKNQKNLKLKDEMYFIKNLTKDIVKNIKGQITVPLMSKYV